MAENYKHLYEQMKKMVELYQDEVVPGLWKRLEQAEQRACADGDYLNRETVVNNVLSQLAVSKSPDAMRERIMNLQGISIEQPTWISCAERLPDEHVDVQMCWKATGTQATGFYTDESWYTYAEDGYYTDCEKAPTHWKAVGEPPKGDE